MKASSSSAALRADGRDGLHDLLGLLSAEVGELAQCADGLQRLFGQLMDDGPAPPQDALERAQTLDGLVQRLQGLETFLAVLGARELDDVRADAEAAANALSLSSQAARFSARGAVGLNKTPAGDCDLF